MGGEDFDGSFTTFLSKLKEHIARFDLALAENVKVVLDCETKIKELIKSATGLLKVKPGEKKVAVQIEEAKVDP
jgi:hypothetical protein